MASFVSFGHNAGLSHKTGRTIPQCGRSESLRFELLTQHLLQTFVATHCHERRTEEVILEQAGPIFEFADPGPVKRSSPPSFGTPKEGCPHKGTSKGSWGEGFGMTGIGLSAGPQPPTGVEQHGGNNHESERQSGDGGQWEQQRRRSARRTSGSSCTPHVQRGCRGRS